MSDSESMKAVLYQPPRIALGLLGTSTFGQPASCGHLSGISRISPNFRRVEAQLKSGLRRNSLRLLQTSAKEPRHYAAHSTYQGRNWPPIREHLKSQIGSTLIVSFLALGALIAYGTVRYITSEASESFEKRVEPVPGAPGTVYVDDFDEMDKLPGRLGNLTPEEEQKLMELWTLLSQICGVADESPDDSAPPTPVAASKSAANDADKTPKKKRGLSLLRKIKKEKDSVSSSEASSVVSMDGVKPDDPEDKYGQNKIFQETLAHRTPASIRETIWTMLKSDHPDQLVLRFLRARKWDVQRALVMLISTMKWRQDFHLDDDVMVNAEEYFLQQEKSAEDETKNKFARDFLVQLRLGKSFTHGIDKDGRPISIVRVRLHRAGEQMNESLDRFTVHMIETTRLMLIPPVDTGCLVFDMTGFTLANMDYTPVKFMIQVFEANYPESLGVILVHKAPWVFQGIWKIIRGWLDPVVAGKVHFTNNVQDVSEFIPMSRIPKDMEGEDEWSYKYIEPVPGENDKMKDTVTRDKLTKERELLYEEFEKLTLQWIKEPEAEKREAIKKDRNETAKKLKESYWVLDPYIRARSLYDRVGIIQPGGKIDYYPKANAEVPAVDEKTAPIAPPVTNTAADDVD